MFLRSAKRLLWDSRRPFGPNRGESGSAVDQGGFQRRNCRYRKYDIREVVAFCTTTSGP